MSDEYSLANLHGIVVPDPPPLWPPAPGFWLLLGCALASILIVAFQVHRTRRRNAYRSAGLAELEAARTLHDVSVVLKRVALAAFPRAQVASLYGKEWADFLRHTCSRADCSAIEHGDPDEHAGDHMRRLATRWIRHHRAPMDGPGRR